MLPCSFLMLNLYCILFIIKSYLIFLNTQYTRTSENKNILILFLKCRAPSRRKRCLLSVGKIMATAQTKINVNV